jgi:hypothetical protein
MLAGNFGRDDAATRLREGVFEMNKRTTRFLALIGVAVLALVLIGPGANILAQARPRATAQQATPCLAGGRWGMMGNWGSTERGMMNGGGMMGGMWGEMGSMGMMGDTSGTATPVSEADARTRFAEFAADCGADVHVADVMAFASNYYAQLVDGNGNGLGEVLVDSYTGAVYPEPGPNMMWNTAWGLGSTGAAQFDQSAAQQIATTFLAGYLPGAAVVEGQAFPGYYTFDFGRDHAVEGMLSVNATTGDVWVHTWHGPALAGHDGTGTDD